MELILFAAGSQTPESRVLQMPGGRRENVSLDMRSSALICSVQARAARDRKYDRKMCSVRHFLLPPPPLDSSFFLIYFERDIREVFSILNFRSCFFFRFVFRFHFSIFIEFVFQLPRFDKIT